MTVYRCLLHLYPRTFREEFGEDMEHLVRCQLRDEHGLRVGGRVLLDLALTVPAQHLEVLMSSPAAPSAFYAVLGGAALLVAVATVATVGLSLVSLVLGVALLVLAAVAWQRAQPLGGPTPTRGALACLVVGGAGLTTTLVAVQGADELAAGPWALFAVSLLASVAALALGLGLLVTRHRRAPSA